MDVKDELRKLEQRRQKCLSIVHDPRRKRFDRETARGDLELVETKIAELRKRIPGEEDEHLFDIGGEG